MVHWWVFSLLLPVFAAQLVTGTSSTHLSSGFCHLWHSMMGPYPLKRERGGEKGAVLADQRWVSGKGLQALLVVPGCRGAATRLCISDEKTLCFIKTAITHGHSVPFTTLAMKLKAQNEMNYLLLVLLHILTWKEKNAQTRSHCVSRLSTEL